MKASRYETPFPAKITVEYQCELPMRTELIGNRGADPQAELIRAL